MVRVERDVRFRGRRDRYQDDLIIRLGDLEPLSYLSIEAGRKMLSLHLDHVLGTVRTVSLVRRYHHGLLLADVHTEHRLFEPGDQLPFAHGEAERTAVPGRVEDRSVLQPPRIIDLHRVSLLCLRHAVLPDLFRCERPRAALTR